MSKDTLFAKSAPAAKRGSLDFGDHAFGRRDFLRGATAVAATTVMASAMSLAGPARAAGLTKVVATTGMIADAVNVLLGKDVELHALMGPGVDPHAFRQTRSDILAMSRADLVLYHGLYLEAQMESFLNDLSRRRRVVPVAEVMAVDDLLSHADYEGRYDPHLWMAPRLWRQVVAGFAGTLAQADPSRAADIAARADAYLTQIDRLDTYARDVLTTVPEPARVLVTAHDAFGYFGADFDFEVMGIQGISTESEAGLNRIRQLVDTLVTRKIGAVFVETSVSDRNMRALIEGAAAKGHRVTIGGALFSDAMGAKGSYEGSYIGMIDHNVTTIARALGGQAPERGLNGKLATAS
jgi:manganese/zinc/iron transport system substrate-binding protein